MTQMLTSDQVQISVKVDKPHYYPGDVLKGVVYLKIKTTNINANLLFIKFAGLQKVNQVDQLNQFFSFKKFFLQKKKILSNLGFPLPIALIKKTFEIKVSTDIPSFCINYYKTLQCRILYFLSVHFTNDNQTVIYKPEKQHRVVIHVIKQPHVQKLHPIIYMAEKKGLKRFCMLNGGIAKIQLQLKKQEYLIGEELDIRIEVDNTLSSLSLLSFEFSIQSELVILYPKLSQKITNYFGLACSGYQVIVDAHEKKLLEYQLQLTQNTSDYLSIYPQSTVISERILYNYNFCLIANYAKPFGSQPNQLTLAIPIAIYQPQKRNQSQTEKTQNDNALLQNIGINSSLQSLQSSILKQKIIYSDHNYDGYGPQDGYQGETRNINPEESLDEMNMVDQNYQQEMNQQKISSDNNSAEELENEISSMNGTQQLFSSGQINGQNTSQVIFSRKSQQENQNNQESELHNSIKNNNNKDNLQVIQEEIDDKSHNHQIMNEQLDSYDNQRNSIEPLSDMEDKQNIDLELKDVKIVNGANIQKQFFPSGHDHIINIDQEF